MDKRITGRMLLAMDIDGTSVGRDHRLGEKTRQALRRFRQAGRNEFDMWNMCGDHREADYVICNTGGKILRAADDTVLSLHLADAESVRALAGACLGHDDCVLYVIAAGYMGVSRMTPGVREYTDSIRCRPAVYASAEELPLAGVQVMMASGNVSRVVAAIRGGGLALDYVSSDPGVIDITPRGVGKWSALLELCRMEGIPPENVAAAGNYLNDRDMIEHAGIGIAVGNAVPEIKALADIVLQHDCEHDAIAELVDKLLAM